MRAAVNMMGLVRAEGCRYLRMWQKFWNFVRQKKSIALISILKEDETFFLQCLDSFTNTGHEMTVALRSSWKVWCNSFLDPSAQTGRG